MTSDKANELATEMQNHAWLARFRNGVMDGSPFVAQQIARHVDDLIAAILAKHAEPAAEPVPKPRCNRCGWPLVAVGEGGCTVGSCSQRPLPAEPEPVKANAGQTTEKTKTANPYLRRIIASNGPDKGKAMTCDIYDILTAFGITNVGQIQALKKALRGGRTDKSWSKDMREAIHSLNRAIEIEEARG